MQYFYINQGSTLNVLRMELVQDGIYDFMKSSHFDNALQNADITFSMVDAEGNLKISDAPCTIAKADEGTCNEHYIIEYHWQKRDTRTKGTFYGIFKIHFYGDLKEEGEIYDEGDIILPIHEQLAIVVK